ncbi:MAG: hypothetical protein GOU97_04120 [Nanoarchaeota archaeon]|nr:hypothetical protein [Nanoarchaeota archaeon]
MKKLLVLGLALIVMSPVLAQANEIKTSSALDVLKTLYEKKQGQYVEPETLNAINKKLQNNTKVKKILEVWSGTEFSLEITQNNSRIFAITSEIHNETIQNIYFGVTEGAGTGNHVYMKLEMSKFSKIIEEWIQLLSREKTGLTEFISLYIRTNTVTLSALASKDIVIKPVWVLFTKSYSMIGALGSYEDFLGALKMIN